MTTIRKIKQLLEMLAQSHNQIKSFFFDLPQVAMNKNIDYPVMIAYIAADGGIIERHKLQVNLIINILDKLRDDEENLTDLESDTLEIISDIFTSLNTSVSNQQILIARNASLTKIADKMKDRVVGWQLSMPIEMRYVSSTCIAPFAGGICADGSANIKRSDGSLITALAVPSGGIVTYTVNDSIVKNSDNSYSANVMADSSFTLPDEVLRVYVNGDLISTTSFIPLDNAIVNINV